jgi:uncharacterized protein (DUF1501 family)
MTLSGFGIASLFPMPFINQAMAGALSGDNRFLFIFLRGGNDGLNSVIPHGDPDYNQIVRPTLYIGPGQSIDLNGFASLHPALAPLMDLYNAGQLAVIHRVGYPNSSKSHFDGSRIWENGDPARPGLYEGWLNRYILENAVAQGVELPALSVQPTPPVILQGKESFVNIADPDGFNYTMAEPKRTKYRTLWTDIASNLIGLERYRPVLQETQVKLVDVMDEYASWDQQNWTPRDPDSGWCLFPVDGTTNEPGFGAKAFPFFKSLKVCALSLLESIGNNNGTRVAGTQQGGFDSHIGQGALAGQISEQLSWVAYGIRSLHVVLSGAADEPRGYPGIWDKVTVATISEFGRATEENGGHGTDHGVGSAMFLAGGPIHGGVYNCDSGNWPGGVLFGDDGRYLHVETDFRAVFWELLRDHMGANPATVDAIFPNYTALGLGSQELGLINV